MATAAHGIPTDRNPEATLFVASLDTAVDEEILWELFLQCGPLVNVYIPRDKITGEHQGYGFVEFKSAENCEYALACMNAVKLFSKSIRLNRATEDRSKGDIGANLFVGNLDPDIDEKRLYEAFSAFGKLIGHPRVGRDESGKCKGHAFVRFDSFEASDAAIQALDSQFLGGRAIRVQYAYKNGGAKGERHGTVEERLIAANLPRSSTLLQMQPAYGVLGANHPPPLPSSSSMSSSYSATETMVFETSHAMASTPSVVPPPPPPRSVSAVSRSASFPPPPPLPPTAVQRR
eukprot:ANDGO_08630.mRNA.1 Splicing factor 3B subunit 4